LITQIELKKLVTYDPNTGVFQHTSVNVYSISFGKIYPTGHSRIRIAGTSYLLQDLAWLYIYGYVERGRVFMRDFNRQNLKLENLHFVSKIPACSFLTQYRLKQLVQYDEIAGAFTWRVKPCSNIQEGSIAGTLRRDGYSQIQIDGHLVQTHRLVWYYCYGHWPVGVIDHINGDRNDNRISNLRDTTASGNNQNRRTAIHNKSTGLLGASFVKRKGKYQAQIKINGKQFGLGLYKTAEEAHQVYLKAKREYHPTCSI